MNYFKACHIDAVTRFSYVVALLTILLFSISFWGMDSIPAFADNPLLAKFGGGEYNESYRYVAVFYRSALILATISVIMLLLRWGISRHKYIIIFLLLALFLCMVLSLRRSLVFGGFFTVLFSYMALQSKVRYGTVVLVYFLIFLLGSASNDIFFYLIGLQDAVSWEAVFRGVPDIADQVWFLTAWNDGHWDYTYGFTLIGGLVPFNFDYNMGAYTLKVIGSQAGETASGGFRLPLPILGYISFGWIGVVLFTALSAYIEGSVLFALKNSLQEASPSDFMVLNTLFIPFVVSSLGTIIYGVTLDKVFALCVVCLLGRLACKKGIDG